MTAKLNSVTISIPAYNEEKNIPLVVEKSIEVLNKITDDYEIVIINDGSIDNTGNVARELAKNNPRIKVYHHQTNQGIAQTLKEVFLKPTKEWVFFIPGDGQIPPEEIFKLLPKTHDFDFILGKRAHRKDNFIRRLNARIYNTVISILAGEKVTDVDSVALYKRSILADHCFIARSAFIHAEIFIYVKRNKFRSIEVEIAHQPRIYGTGTGNNIGVILKTALDLIRLFVLKPLK
ncbi:MAG: hypothetical protein A2252_03110 [Elusimicrobia bacterium RIFOXYA2_FULL_39_19]|nr:MAG: hypothetical protein A2252_03110 [Elusimicrobia bacterium RIFOXYA2_FULL_39_19]